MLRPGSDGRCADLPGERAADLGANSYLVKPVQFDNLQEMVRTLRLYWLQLNERPELR